MTNIHIESSARLWGKLRLGDGAIIAQGTVLTSIGDSITIGNDSAVLENSVLIGTPDQPMTVGSKTIFGHKCIAIGAKIGDLCEIGNGTIFLPGSEIGDMCIFGEGTLIPENMKIPDGSVVVGNPCRIIRLITDADKAMVTRMRGNDISLRPYHENILEFEFSKERAMNNLFSFGDKFPQIADSAVIYDTAEITGDVIIGENSVITSGVRIIGNAHGPVRIGKNVKILENCVLHLLPDNELIIEDNVTIGPGSIIHGTTIGAGSVIESGVILSDYSKLGANSLVKVGSLIKQRAIFEDNAIIKGSPAKDIGKNMQPLESPAWAIRG